MAQLRADKVEIRVHRWLYVLILLLLSQAVSSAAPALDTNLHAETLLASAPDEALAAALKLYKDSADPRERGTAALVAGKAALVLDRTELADQYLQAANALAPHLPPAQQLAIRYALARLHFQRGEFAACEALLEAELESAPAAGVPRIEASIWNLYGLCAARQARYSDAATRYQRSLTIQRQRGDRQAIALALNNLGNAWKNLGQPGVALDLHLESLQMRREINDVAGITQSLSNIVLVYQQLGDVPAALRYSKEALERVRHHPELPEVQRISINHAELLARSEQAAAGLALLDELEPELKKAAPLLRRGALSARAQILNALGETEQARALAEQGVALARTMGEPKELIEALEVLGSLQTATAAEAAFTEAATLAQSSAALMSERSLRLRLTELLEQRGALAQALAQWRRLEEISEAAGSLATARRVAVLERQLADVERARELGQLRATETLQAALISRQRWVGALALATLLSLLLLLGWRVREVRRRQLVAERNRAELSAKNAQLERLANTDALTGLGNRQYLRAHLERLAAAEGVQALALLDIDLFKQINDVHGHDAGDRVLVALADVLRQLPPADVLIGRWGGEEFLLLFPGISSELAANAVGHLRDLVHALQVPVDNGNLQVRFSAGVAARQQPMPADAWLKQADEALYRAKHLGRDRIEVAAVGGCDRVE